MKIAYTLTETEKFKNQLISDHKSGMHLSSQDNQKHFVRLFKSKTTPLIFSLSKVKITIQLLTMQ